MNKYNISVDCGKAFTKICVAECGNPSGNIKTDIFPTKTDVVGNLSNLVKADVCRIDNGTPIAIGNDNLNIVTSDNDSKREDITKQCILYGIARNIQSGDIVNVVIGCPILEYSNKEKTIEYMDYVIPKGKHTVEITDTNGKTRTVEFGVEKRIVLPESTGILYLKPDEFINTRAIVDIGGRNINAVQANKNGILPSTAITAEYGSKLLLKELSKGLLRVTGGNKYNIQQLQEIIETGYDPLDKKSTAPIVEKVIHNHLQGILGILDAEWDNQSTLSLVFVGGTSNVLKRSITKELPNRAVFLDDNPKSIQFSNCKGFLYMLQKVLRERT